ncbi:class C sortase [Lacticaseibacillus baoqingensis]|uniref:Class C sortase n=1 Tax=Lacticaseibacillus baoqingensis TaxID=2486013 RepID=A0ABW4E5I4_9LACO|nr:class C sortase [Lacticaseibacillus baoqingensis]
MAKRRHRTIGDIIVLLIFFAGLAVFSYPFVANAVNNIVVQWRLQDDRQQAAKNEAKLRAKQKAYNAELAQNGLRPNADEFKTNRARSGSAAYRRRHLLGAVTIPTLKVNIPLYDTTNETLLQSGAVVLPGTSYPRGGKSTHTVVSAHSGLPTKQLFTDLEDMKKGDRFVLTVGKRHLAYQVDRIRVVKPTQVDALKIEKGRDLATLMTCTPYMINSHRLLVTGHRVPYTDDLAKQTQASDRKRWWQSWALIAVAIAAVGVLIWLLIRIIKRRKQAV